MHRYMRYLAVLAALSLVSISFTATDAQARAGGGRSMGSRGSRSYMQPVAPPSQGGATRQYAPSGTPYQQPYQTPYRQPSRGLFGNFGSSMLGGIAGGMLGGMLFRSLGFGGGYGGGGGGIGLFDILLLAGIAYLIYRFVTRRRAESEPYQRNDYGGPGNVIQMGEYQNAVGYQGGESDLSQGIAHIRQMDPGFDERRFNDQVMDIFFKIHGAWMNRDLGTVTGLLTDEMRGIFQRDLDDLKRLRRVNRLENIAVRTVEISEAWQEGGKDFVTALIYANLLDYTTDEATGEVLAGNKTDPVKFEEYWTFTRPVGNNPWMLSGIDQK